jgi:hypothetical protein
MLGIFCTRDVQRVGPPVTGSFRAAWSGSRWVLAPGGLFVNLLPVFNMASCNHSTLELLPERKTTLRCRYCHLTISSEELGDGFCPECFDARGNKRYEFEQIAASEAAGARYRCEECGVIITSPGRP